MEHPVLLSIAIEPKTRADQDKLRRGLAVLTALDTTFHARTDPHTNVVVIGGTSDQQLEVILHRLSREFGVEARVGRPRIAYREMLTQPADGEMKYARHTDGRGQYGHVKVHLAPGEPGSGYVFEKDIVGGAIPPEFITAVDAGLRDALEAGVLAGYPVHDVRVTLYDGSYHDADSSDEAFRIAAAMAFRDAAKKARPVLLEPVMRVEVVVLEEHVDDVKGNLMARRGQLLHQEGRRGMQVVTALVPLGEMFGYAADLRDRTLGRGRFAMRFARYQPCPLRDEGDGASYVATPRARPPTPKATHTAVPEPDDGQIDTPGPTPDR
jgi:elongation factor G